MSKLSPVSIIDFILWVSYRDDDGDDANCVYCCCYGGMAEFYTGYDDGDGHGCDDDGDVVVYRLLQGLSEYQLSPLLNYHCSLKWFVKFPLGQKVSCGFSLSSPRAGKSVKATHKPDNLVDKLSHFFTFKTMP